MHTSILIASVDHVTSGPVAPEARVGIVDPETNRIVKIGERGELHVGGSHVIRAYLSGTSADILMCHKCVILATKSFQER